MMDRLLRWVKDIRQATYLDVQNVSDYFWSDRREYWDLQDFNMAPPFEFFATRYTLPETAYSEEHGLVNIKGNITGVAEILTVFRTATGVPNYIQRPAGPGKEANTADRITMPDAKWYYDILVFCAIGREVLPPGQYFMALDEHGTVACQSNGARSFFATRFNKKFEVSETPLSWLHVSGLALTFLHSRNVEIIQPPPPTKKRLPHKIKFESRYHWLKVNPVGRQYKSASESGQGSPKSLHIVRGHFREYGINGKGKLFGKLTGRFWVAGHAKGSAMVGQVTKDYQVDAPGE